MFPSVIILALLLISLVSLEVITYQKAREVIQMETRYNQGKMMTKLTVRILQQNKEKEAKELKSKGEMIFNLGKVSYEFYREKLIMDVFVNDRLIYSDAVKWANKKAVL